VGVLFTVAAGMYSTGAITLIADKLIGLPKTLSTAQIKILPPVSVTSAFLNNTPLVAMMIPVVRDISLTARLAVSKLLIPVSYASILGGAATVIGTSDNLIIAGLAADAVADGALEGMDPINIFDPTLIGLPAAVVGIIFIIFIGVKLLPQPEERQSDETRKKRLYRAEFVIQSDSFLVGKTVGDTGLDQGDGYALISLERGSELLAAAEPGSDSAALERLVLQDNDVLTFHTDAEAVPELWAKIGLKPAVGRDVDGERHDHQLVEVVVAPQNADIGRRVSEIPVREDRHYVDDIVASSRNGMPTESPILNETVMAGDNAILEVEDNFFYATRNELEFSLVRRLHGYRVQRVDRAALAALITLTMVLLAAFGVMSMLNAGLLAFLAMLLTGCIGLERAWASIDWKTLVVLGAAIGLESAITATGLSQVIADVLSALGGDSPTAALAIVFIGAVVMTNIISNAAVAAFLFPVALSMANNLEVNFLPFAMILMLGTSYAFINPAGYQTNLMVQGPGNYEFKDFVKIGIPLTILVGIVALLLAPIVYGF
jgi:di/tricarboxylate transporter